VHSCRLPPSFLDTRALVTSIPAAAGDLVAIRRGQYLPSLAPFNPLLARVSTIEAPQSGGATLPIGDGLIATNWQSDEVVEIPEQTQVFSAFNSKLKILSSFGRVSRQMLIQSDASDVLGLEIKRSAATALAAAVLQATGADGQPTGILATPGILTAAGAAISYGATVAAAQAVVAADGVRDPAALAWMLAPDAAGLLATRFINGVGSAPILDSIPAGSIGRAPAFSTTLMPAATALYGDFSSVYIVEYPNSGILEVDPFSGFQTLMYSLRLTLYLDIACAFPTSLYSLTAIT
jgi:HK97 family phage major capsid protein